VDDIGTYLQFVVAPQVVDGLMIGMAIVLVALGLTLIFGLLEVINMAHGELYMAGAYAALTAASVGLGFWGSLILAPIFVALIGLIIERMGFRPLQARPHRAILTILLTFGISLMLRDAARAIWGPDPHGIAPPITGVFNLGGVLIPNYRLMVLVIATLLVITVWYVLQRTIVGAIVRAAAYDQQMTATLGIPVGWVYSGTFVVGCLLAGTAGVLLAPIYSVFPTMGRDFMLLAFAAVIVGGMGSVPGTVIGGLLLAQIQSVTSIWIPPVWAETLVFITMLVVLTIKPDGLFGKLGRR
jgi:branched-chain amino acid transport system permease protein